MINFKLNYIHGLNSQSLSTHFKIGGKNASRQSSSVLQGVWAAMSN
jgi:hypothetical protein